MHAFQFITHCNFWQRLGKDKNGPTLELLPPPPTPTAPLPKHHPSLSQLAALPPDQLPTWVRQSPLAMKYIALLGELDWAHFPERRENRMWPGPKPHSRAPFVAAYLVKINENKKYMTDLLTFLSEQPALAWVVGFDLLPSSDQDCGFDMKASLPSRKQLGRVLRELPNEAAQFLLTGTVHLLQTELGPDLQLGEAISLDTKHIIAWVRENNLKTFVRDRYDKSKQPAADPDCRLGFKARNNRGSNPKSESTPAGENQVQEQTAPLISPAQPDSTPDGNPATPATYGQPASKTKVGDYYWGYASGVVATKVPGWGEFVLAELTQPFNQSDASYFLPLMAQTEARLGYQPRNGALDAAFDAFYVYAYFHNAGGMAAVPFADRASHRKQFTPDGLPLCAAGLGMPLIRTYNKKSHCLIPHPCGVFHCPLLFPEQSEQLCPIQHKNWSAGGCQTVLPTSVGNRVRHELDRESDAYKQLYRQRSATERVNSQAVELGIERPKLRNQAAIANQNTLIYVLINLKALQRVRQHKEEAARTGAHA